MIVWNYVLLLQVIVTSSNPQDELMQWLSEAEMNVSVGSFWMIMGGNKSAHNVSDMVEKAAKRAQTPNIKRTVKYFDGCNQAQCAENLSLEIVQWLISRDKKYGVAILRKADETALWLLKAIATYWWGQRRCRHPLLLPDAVDCERVAWFLSTQFASEHVLRLENTLTAKNTPLELNRAVAQAARDEWSGALGNRAARRALFVRGQVSVENKIQLFEYFLQKQKEENTTHKHKLGARFVGQTGAIAEVATYLERIGERRSRKTPTVFYFYGVAGSGKSRLAELIAENLHRPLVRLEMESYNTEIDVNRLFGAPAAYEQGGVSLVDELLLHPNAVVLMDEIDKAHVSIFREKLHTALSAGVMTHKQDLNRSADVSNVIFIFTTNCFENQVQSIFSQLIHNASIIHGGKDIDDSVLYSTARTALEILINDAPRIPCSSSKPNPFEDGSLRSRIPRTKQFPFLPLRKHELQSLVVIEFKRLAQELDLNLTWSPKLPATFLDLFPHFTDARVLVERINDDFDHAILNINAHHSNKAIITLADDGHLKFLWIFSSEDDDALIPYEHNTIPSLSSKETSCAQSTAQKIVTSPVLEPKIEYHEQLTAAVATVIAIVVATFVCGYGLWLAITSPTVALLATAASVTFLYAAYLTSPVQAYQALAALTKYTLFAAKSTHWLLRILIIHKPFIFLPLLLFSFIIWYHRTSRAFCFSSRTLITRGTMTDPVRIIISDNDDTTAFVVVPPFSYNKKKS